MILSIALVVGKSRVGPLPPASATDRGVAKTSWAFDVADVKVSSARLASAIVLGTLVAKSAAASPDNLLEVAMRPCSRLLTIRSSMINSAPPASTSSQELVNVALRGYVQYISYVVDDSPRRLTVDGAWDKFVDLIRDAVGN
ncbi:hypothetical protein FGB62_3g148 [Gracilaria domingensis]|nr:hypothetical protein FGB62_3g148 [Gracilaria domingensis]